MIDSYEALPKSGGRGGGLSGSVSLVSITKRLVSLLQGVGAS